MLQAVEEFPRLRVKEGFAWFESPQLPERFQLDHIVVAVNFRIAAAIWIGGIRADSESLSEEHTLQPVSQPAKRIVIADFGMRRTCVGVNQYEIVFIFKSYIKQKQN